MLNIFSSRSKDESSENIAVVTEQVEEENEFNHSARILSDRIALTEVRIQKDKDFSVTAKTIMMKMLK